MKENQKKGRNAFNYKRRRLLSRLFALVITRRADPRRIFARIRGIRCNHRFDGGTPGIINENSVLGKPVAN